MRLKKNNTNNKRTNELNRQFSKDKVHLANKYYPTNLPTFSLLQILLQVFFTPQQEFHSEQNFGHLPHLSLSRFAWKIYRLNIKIISTLLCAYTIWQRGSPSPKAHIVSDGSGITSIERNSSGTDFFCVCVIEFRHVAQTGSNL
jgi:hypothetical protein